MNTVGIGVSRCWDKHTPAFLHAVFFKWALHNNKNIEYACDLRLLLGRTMTLSQI